MLNNITVDQDDFLNKIKEEYNMLIVDAIKNSQLEFSSQLLYDEVLEFCAIVQMAVRELKRRKSELRRICANSHTEGKDKATQMSELESLVEELTTMENNLMQSIEL